MRGRAQQWERPQGRRAVFLAAVLGGAAVLAAAGGLAISGGPGGGRLAVAPSTNGQAAPSPAALPDTDTADPAIGAWAAGTPAPLAARAGHSATSTDEEVIVWGGRSPTRHLDDGAAYHPRRDTWRRIAPAPLRGRTDHAAVWTGRELLIWGGRRSDAFGPLALSDGAAYDPATDTWRTLPDAPIDGRWSATAVWTGDRLLVWGGRAQQLRTVYLGDGAVYDPADDAWRALPRPPSRAGWSPAAVWTGEELLAWGAVSPARETASGLAYRPDTDRWQHLGAAPLPVASPAVAAWSAAGAVVATPGQTLAFDRAANRWTRAPAVPVAIRSATRAVQTREGLVVLDGHTGRGATLSVDAGRVLPLPEIEGGPGPTAPGARFAAAWTGSSLVVVGGADGDDLRTVIWSPPVRG